MSALERFVVQGKQAQGATVPEEDLTVQSTDLCQALQVQLQHSSLLASPANAHIDQPDQKSP